MINSIVKTFIDFIYPHACLLCREKMPYGSTRELVCASCLDAVRRNSPPFCQKCGRKIKGTYTSKNICRDCRQAHYHFDRAWASCSYEGAVKEMIHNFKYKNKIPLKKYLSQLMTEFIKEYRLPVNYCDYIAPVPLSAGKFREREFNQSTLLAENIARDFGINILKDNLIRVRDTPSQTTLDMPGRRENVRGAFALKKPEEVREKIILLVDDVLTSGSTASEAACALKGAGADVVFVLTLAN